MNYEQYKKLLPLSELIVKAFSISTLVLLVSFFISQYLGDWQWFARGGSILVCIGVLTAAYDIKGRMIKEGGIPKHIEQTVILEAIIVVVGTLVWGFGDLIGYLY
ncbi:hypothetical protein [Psychromonas sp. SP041]|uniref:hypothetical protein n=1 Tax=Psychromonas sp. SP041 TaxID=1365007 RepID=UPI0010C7871F|nr:hypothetical protein [Psychromonas sp. SP041]